MEVEENVVQLEAPPATTTEPSITATDTDTQGVELTSTDTQQVELSSTDTQQVELPSTDTQQVELSSPDTQEVELPSTDTQRVELSSTDTQTAELLSTDTQKVELLPDEPLQKKQSRKSRRRTSIWLVRKRKKKPKEKKPTEIDSEGLVTKNHSLLTKCGDLKKLNKQLAEENTKLRQQLENHETETYTQPVYREYKLSQKKLDSRAVSALTGGTLLALWKEASLIELPECKCVE